MTDLSRLAHRVVMAAFSGPVAPDWLLDRLGAGIGSVCVFGSNVTSVQQLGELTESLRAGSPDVLVATDEEGGDVTRLHMRKGSPHPGNAALGAVDDEALTTAVAVSIGAELAAAGIDLNLAPVVDVNSNPRNPVIGVRSFGADPHLVARHAAAYVRGLQSAGVGACVKHYPGHGDTAVDSHLGLPTVDIDRAGLFAGPLLPFRAAVEAGSLAVMTSHVLFPRLDPRLPATFSKDILRMLREDLRFDGLAVSDALDMAGASQSRGEPAAAVLALAAGSDLLCLGPDNDASRVDTVVSAVVEAVQAGELPAARLADAAARVEAAASRIRSSRAVRRGLPDLAASRTVAARALEVTGRLPDLEGAVVVRFRTDTSIAVGEVPWGLPDGGVVLCAAAAIDVDQRTVLGEILKYCTGRPLVVLLRSPCRETWVPPMLDALARRRPDLVTVEMGWPGPDPLPGTATIRTYGASLANSRALDSLLAAHASSRAVP